MKFANNKNSKIKNAKLTKTKFAYCSLLLIILSSCLTFSSANKMSSESMAPEIIKNQLDYLINTLEDPKTSKGSISPLTSTKNKTFKKISNKNSNKNKNIQDEVVNAIHDLNKDFIEYDDILSDDSDKNNNSGKNSLKENENIFEELKSNNLNQSENSEEFTESESNDDTLENKISDSSQNYLNEVISITKNIDNSLENFDLYDKYEKEREKVKKRLSHVQEIIQNVTELKKHLDIIKNNKHLIEEKRQKMKNISENLLKQYTKYLSIEKNVDQDIHKELQEIKKNLNLSFSFKTNFDDFIKVFVDLLNFHKKINIGDEEDLNKKFQKFKEYVNSLTKKDRINSEMM